LLESSVPKRSGCVKIDNEFELRRLLDRQVCGLGALEDRHTKIDLNTVRYLSIEVDDALTTAEQVDV
jgi:hypothetical protein